MALPALIDSVKSTAVTYQPLLLCTLTFADGSVLRLSSHPLNVAEGGVQYGGHDYLGRISEQDIAQVQALSEQGIDAVPSVTLHLADADKFLWLNYEQPEGLGFKGATLALTFVFYDVDAGTFSSDSLLKFTGVCDTPSADDRALTVTANSLINVQRRQFPIVPIQRRCPWVNPTTLAHRAEAGDEDSIYYECGETRDLTTAPPCKYTKETCTQATHFGGITYSPPDAGSSRVYVSGQHGDFKSDPNEAKYGDYFPMVYGTAWVEPPVLWSFPEGNSNRGECVVCNGEVEDIWKVVVNDVEVPPATDIDGNPYRVQDPLFRYNVVNRGDRAGGSNIDTPVNGQGDPYGNLCALFIVLPREKVWNNGIPRVRVLVRGPKIRVYTSSVTYTKVYSENPIWILLDLLIWTNFTYADIDIDSFIAAAAVCDQSISYTDQNGSTSTHARYACSIALRQRRSAADIIRGVRQCCNAVLVPNSATGKLQVFIKRTLADQQPSGVSGSNAGGPVSSVTAAGVVTDGYPAFVFDENTILRDSQNRSTLRLFQQPISSSPNRVSFQFSDDALMRAASSISLVDSEDVSRAQQEVTGSVQIDGVPNYDQAVRIARTYLAEVHRGNEAGDTRGTRWFECEVSFAAVRLRVGHIGILSSVRYGIADQLVRITKIQPTRNFETVKITGHFHSDLWYTDAYAQQPEPRSASRRRDRLARPSFPWGPNVVQPPVSDSMMERTRFTFKLEPIYETIADGTQVSLAITGKTPVNDFAALKAPLVQAQGTTAASGGTVPGGGWVYWMAVCATDANQRLSAPSALCRVAVTVGSGTNTITVPVVSWDADTVGWTVFAGQSPNSLTYQADGTGTPSSITISAFNEARSGVPDQEFDRLRVKVKRVAHAGVFGAEIAALGANTVQINGGSWFVNEWAGYDLSPLALVGSGAIPVQNYSIVSNTADTLTLNRATTGLAEGDIVVMRSKPTISNGGKTLSDARWANALSNAGAGLVAADEVGRYVRIISGTGRGQVRRIASANSTSVTVDSDWGVAPDSGSRYIIEEAGWLQSTETSPLANSDPSALVTVNVPVTNYTGQALLVMPFTVDGGGNESVESLTPFREVYIKGTPAAPAAEGYSDDAIVGGTITPDIADGTHHRATLDGGVTIAAAIYTGGTLVAGQRLTLKLVQDGTGGRTVAWHADYLGVTGMQVDLTAGTYSHLLFAYNPEGKWELQQATHGLS